MDLNVSEVMNEQDEKLTNFCIEKWSDNHKTHCSCTDGAEDTHGALRMVDKVDAGLRDYGLEINICKTKVTVTSNSEPKSEFR